MRKLGYVLFHRDATDIIEESEYLTSNGCSVVFMDFYNCGKEYPEFNRLISLSRPNDIVVVRKLSFLATSFSHLIEVIQLLMERSIHLICIDQTIDTQGQGIEVFKLHLKVFDRIYAEQIDAKRKQTRKENEDKGITRRTAKGVRDSTLRNARKVWSLKLEGRLSNSEIMEITQVTQGTFYKYCKWGKDGKIDI